MRKVITISGKDYEMKANAHILWTYRREFGTELFDDSAYVSKTLQEAILKPQEEQNMFILKHYGELSMKVLQMAYVMIIECDEHFMPFEKWLKEVDDLISNKDWMNEVMALATTFR